MAKRIALDLGDPMFDKISGLIRKSYPNSCILWVDRVENADLEAKFQARKEAIQSTRGTVDTRQLFHGTKPDVIDSICYEGFNPDMNVTSAYGRGTYFAQHASYSKSYMRAGKDEISYMFVADVLIGKMQNARGYTIDTNVCDLHTDNVNNPTIYVTPYADGAFPRYIVAFHANAK